MYKTIVLIFFVFFVLVDLHAQENIDSLFNSAVKDYENSQLTPALEKFNKLVNKFVLNSKTTIALLFIGKIKLEQKDYSTAEDALTQLINNFPQSKYLDEAKITIAKVMLDKKEFVKSFWMLCNISGDPLHSEMSLYAREKAQAIALTYLSAAEVKSIYDTTKSSSIKSFLLLLIVQIYLERNNAELARETFTILVQLYPESYEVVDAKKILDESINSKNGINQSDAVAVIVPLTANSSEVNAARQILDGIKFALSEFNEGRERKIGILIRDSEFNRKQLEVIHNELVDIPNLKCILGPIYSSEVKDALEIFNDLNIPIISPTATDDYLTETNDNFFQANPSFMTRGKLMAQYAFFVQNKRKLAVLNSIDGYSPILSASFTQEFEKLGGKIILRVSYKSNSFDLKEQIDKLAASINSIEGIYIPLADKADIPVLVSYLSNLNLSIPIYGDQDWMISQGLESAAFLDKNLIFCSDYFLKFNDESYQTFSRKFQTITQMDVNRNILYGYDTMKYLLTVMRTSFAGSDALKKKMISGLSSVGFHNNIAFDSNRINRYMNIVEYIDGKFQLLDKFKLNN